MDTIPEWIKRVRKAAGLSQEALGEAVSRSKGNVSSWEKGRHKPTLQQLLAIAQATDRPKTDLAALFDVPEDVLERLEPSPDDSVREMPAWPFPQIDRRLVSRLEPGQIRMLENALLATAADLRVSIKSKRRSA